MVPQAVGGSVCWIWARLMQVLSSGHCDLEPRQDSNICMTHHKEWPEYNGSAPSVEQSRQAQGSSGHGGLLPGRQLVLQICIMYYVGTGEASQTGWVLGEEEPLSPLPSEGRGGTGGPY